MGLHLATDRIHEQFAHRPQWLQTWIGQPDRYLPALTWRIVGRNPGGETIRQMVDEPGIRCRTGFGDRRNDMRCHKQSPAHKVVEVYPLAAAWSTRFLQPVSAAVRDTRRFFEAKTHQCVKHPGCDQPPATQRVQPSLLATQIGSANRVLKRTFGRIRDWTGNACSKPGSHMLTTWS